MVLKWNKYTMKHLTYKRKGPSGAPQRVISMCNRLMEMGYETQ